MQQGVLGVLGELFQITRVVRITFEDLQFVLVVHKYVDPVVRVLESVELNALWCTKYEE